MKILGVGLSKTGTSSLHRALGLLGLRSLHYDDARLNDVVHGTAARPDFRRYDDVDAVLDIPAAHFFVELTAAYPDCRCILTERNEDDWWRSVHHHFNVRRPIRTRADHPFKWDLRCLVYCSADAREAEYRRRYRAHNARVRQCVPASRLLVMDISGGDGWDPLCRFLAAAVPDAAFPHQNRFDEGAARYRDAAIDDLLGVTSEGDTLVLVDDGALAIAALPGRRVLPFLQRNGVYWGRPVDDREATAAIEEMGAAGASCIAFAWPSFWWLDHYRGFNAHLRRHYECRVQSDRVVVFDLRRRRHAGSPNAEAAGRPEPVSLSTRPPAEAR